MRAGADRCAYCGAWLKQASSGENAAPPAPPDFGLRGPALLCVGAVGGVLLYALGWFFEDTRYWLDARAVAVWTLALPLWTCGIAFFRRGGRGGQLLGLGLGVALFSVHAVLMGLVAGRFTDDYAGISAALGGAAAAGWWLGRLLHAAARRWRAGAQD